MTISEAQKRQSKIYATAARDGRSVQMQWKPESGRFFIKVSDDGSAASDEFATSMAGEVTSLLIDEGDGPVRCSSKQTERCGKALERETQRNVKL